MNRIPDAREQKMALRRAMRQMRATLNRDFRDHASAEICRRILELPPLQTSATVAVYLATKAEANIDAVANELLARGCEVVAPLAHPNYTFSLLRKSIRINEKGWREPILDTAKKTVEPRAIDIILLPALAFDRSGARLGQGGGWYNRVLNNTSCALRIGVCFDCQLIETLPHEPHDQRAQIIVTEKQVIRPVAQEPLKPDETN